MGVAYCVEKVSTIPAGSIVHVIVTPETPHTMIYPQVHTLTTTISQARIRERFHRPILPTLP